MSSLLAAVRKPCPCRSSFALEELVAEVEPGREVDLVCKELSWQGLSPRARLAKPRFLHDDRREEAVYRSLLPDAEPGSPRCYGSHAEGGRRWLFLERVPGRELYQLGERGHWEEAAAWLGRTHARLRPGLERYAAAAPLVEHDAALYRRWMRRALEFARHGDSGRLASLEHLARRHEALVEALLALPATVVHGDYNASNVLVDAAVSPPRVAPVDWELAGRGPGLVDLAALVSGDWGARDREALAAAYFAALGEPFDAVARRDLDCARLQLAVQWLGWAPPPWTPPPQQRQDWLATALELAEELGV